MGCEKNRELERFASPPIRPTWRLVGACQLPCRAVQQASASCANTRTANHQDWLSLSGRICAATCLGMAARKTGMYWPLAIRLLRMQTTQVTAGTRVLLANAK